MPEPELNVLEAFEYDRDDRFITISEGEEIPHALAEEIGAMDHSNVGVFDAEGNRLDTVATRSGPIPPSM